MLADIIRAEHGEGDMDDDKDTSLPGFYYPADYVLMTWQEKRDKGILPESGGLNDQDWRLVYHDWPLLNQRYNRMSAMLYPGDDREPQDYRPYSVPQMRKDISGLLD